MSTSLHQITGQPLFCPPFQVLPSTVTTSIPTMTSADTLTCLMEWESVANPQLLYKPKQMPSFHSSRWATGSSPYVTFSSSGQLPLVVREQKMVFPKSQHQPSLINMGLQISITNSLQKAQWNFLKVQRDVFQEELKMPRSNLAELDLTCPANINKFSED